MNSPRYFWTLNSSSTVKEPLSCALPSVGCGDTDFLLCFRHMNVLFSLSQRCVPWPMQCLVWQKNAFVSRVIFFLLDRHISISLLEDREWILLFESGHVSIQFPMLQWVLSVLILNKGTRRTDGILSGLLALAACHHHIQPRLQH